MQTFMKFGAFIAWILTMLITSCASVAEESNSICKDVKELSSTVQNLYNDSEFIGVYLASKASDDLSEFRDLRNQVWQTNSMRLDLQFALKGRPDPLMYVQAKKIPVHVPSIYFSIDEYHEEVVSEEEPLFGINNLQVFLADETCKFLPTFLPGYLYLVFDNPNQSLNFEPIISPKYDALITVLEELHEVQ